MQNILFEEYDILSKRWRLDKNIPLYISTNLNNKFDIREYQKEAYARFIDYFSNPYNQPIHLLFNMATWSGKTFVMASLILELYEKWYRNFLFFVNSSNIIEKTKENFINTNSSKYLFNDKISFNWKQIKIKEVTNFTTSLSDDINIKFTTIQGLHTDLNSIKENGLSYEDFEDNKIVILSDEAHHINSTTKTWKLGKSEEEEKKSWEYTVMKILNSHKENLLLEFTATIDLKNEFIAEKYSNKIIYKYDLKEFRLDWYSKEVDILKADMEQNDRILQALILSQYRLKIAEKNKIYCKPVILFKAQKTIAESEQNLVNFNKLIKELKGNDIIKIKNITNDKTILKAFRFFDENNISIDNLTKELKEDFSSDNCISANDDKEAWKNQILLNTLEDKNNRIRAVFAVQKLNEWWDVLNLFDIVRLYESRSNIVDKKTWKVKVWPQTISEAQLIWRWARYFPFNTEKGFWEDKYKRKFDKKDDEELKILETFYYHTSFDNLYITEIRQALIETWMMDEKEKKTFKLELKDDFKKSKFYNEWVIYVNERIEKDNSNIDSLEKAWLRKERFEFTLYTWKSGDVKVFDDIKQIKDNDFKIEKEPKTFEIKEIDKRIIKKAIARNDFYRFDNLQRYIWWLESIDEFITSDKYLSAKKIDLFSSKEVLENISKEDKLKSISALLNALESEIKQKEILYRWTTSFKAKSIKETFKDKDISQKEKIFSKSWEWFLYNELTWSDQEEFFINLFEKKVWDLSKKYTDICLLRSERDFAIYSFDDWERFEPDFVLFMKEKTNGKPLSYQVFIEPKWNHLLELDKWKEDFLKQIDDKAEILEMNFGHYKIIGLPFYNKEFRENEFEEAFDNKLIN